MVLKTIDNLFFNTTDVSALAKFYAAALRLPICRETQMMVDSGEEGARVLVWAEIHVGSIQLSFRRIGGTTFTHPDFSQFAETQPASGATVSFRVTDMERSRKALQLRGVTFQGDIFSCTGGKELLSVFKDPWNRTFQLYESLFEDREIERYYPDESHRNRVCGTAKHMEVAFFQDHALDVCSFYSEVLGLVPSIVPPDDVVFRVGGSHLAFMSGELWARKTRRALAGGMPIFLVDQPLQVRRHMESIGAEFLFPPETNGSGGSCCEMFFDPDRNVGQLQRCAVEEVGLA